MPPIIIDLLSSESEPLIPSSSAPAAVQNSQVPPNFLELSDEVEVVSSKRRRLTPSPTRKSVWSTRVASRITALSPKSRGSFIDIDSIIYNSSPPLSPAQRQAEAHDDLQMATQKNISFNTDAGSSPVAAQISAKLSSRTAALLAELDGNRLAGRISSATTESKEKASQGRPNPSRSTVFAPPKPATRQPAKRPNAPLSSIEDFSSQPLPGRATAVAVSTTVNPPISENAPKPRRVRLTTPEREERDALKASKAAEKALAKETKAREKQLAADLAEVNRARHDKKVSVGEMIVRLPGAMSCGPNLTILTKELLTQLGVQVQVLDNPQADTHANMDEPGIEADLVTWRRKVRAKFDDEAGHWVPMPQMEIREEESHVLCVIDAKRFVRMVQYDECLSNAGGVQTVVQQAVPASSEIGLGHHVKLVRSKYPQRKPIYLIEGLEAFMRKSRNARNRSFQAAVRAQEDPEAPASKTAKRKRKQKEDLTVDDDTIEDALLRLQVEFDCLIHHTTAAPDTSEWISHFTQHVSTIPYRTRQSHAEASFCMDVGQIKTGEDKDDTFVKMLQEIVRVTLPVAYGIATQYPSVISLFEGLKREGPLCLQDLRKCSNKNGAFTDARIGPAISRRIYKIFLSENPDSMDV